MLPSALPPNRMASPGAGSSEHPFHLTFHDYTYCGRWGGHAPVGFPPMLPTTNARVDSMFTAMGDDR